MKHLALAVLVLIPKAALAAQGPGVGDGTASPELQKAVVLGFVIFVGMMVLAHIGRR